MVVVGKLYVGQVAMSGCRFGTIFRLQNGCSFKASHWFVWPEISSVRQLFCGRAADLQQGLTMASKQGMSSELTYQNAGATNPVSSMMLNTEI